MKKFKGKNGSKLKMKAYNRALKSSEVNIIIVLF
jgi:hypothetical protein